MPMPARLLVSRHLALLALCIGLGWLSPSVARATSAPVYLNQAGLSTAVQPASFAVAEYNDPHDPNTVAGSRVVGATWVQWGEATTTATGQALVQWTDASTGLHAQAHATVPVELRASGLQHCGGVSVYSHLVISAAAGASIPPHFAQVDRDEHIGPCHVHAADYVAGLSERGDPNGCLFKGLRDFLIRSPYSLFYCAMRWKGWGGNTTTGLGVARDGYEQYGLRVRLSQIRWCKQWTVSYTQETAEIWGAGEIPKLERGNVSSSEAAKLRGLVGRSGQPHKTVHLTMPGKGGCVG